jgi:hypothetical protein
LLALRLNSLLATLNVDSKTNGFVTMDLQKRAQEAALSELVDRSTNVLERT